MKIMLSWIQSDISSNLVIILYHCIFLLLKVILVLDTETFSSWHLCPMIIPYHIFKSFCLRLILYILYHSFRTSYLPKSVGSFFWLLGCGQSHYYWGVPSSRSPQWTEPENTYLHIYIKFSQISVCVCTTIPNILFII